MSNIFSKNVLGVDADDKTWILDDSRVNGKVLVCHDVLHKLFWITWETARNSKLSSCDQPLMLAYLW